MTEQNLEKFIGAGCTQEFRMKVKIAAATADMSLSNYIRKALEDKLKKDSK